MTDLARRLRQAENRFLDRQHELESLRQARTEHLAQINALKVELEISQRQSAQLTPRLIRAISVLEQVAPGPPNHIGQALRILRGEAGEP